MILRHTLPGLLWPCCFVWPSDVVAVGSLPKKIAIQRNHPQVAAINAAGWTLALGGLGWPIAFVWAFLRTDLTDDHGFHRFE